MNKATPAPESAEPLKYAALLNRLFEMTKAPYYATACDTLVLAEMAIVGLERENAALRAEFERLAAQAEPAPAPVGEYPALPKPARQGPWPGDPAYFIERQMHAYLDADRAQRPAREVRLLTSKDLADVRETLWRNTQVNLSDLHAEDAAKAFQRKFCEVNGLTVKEQS